MVRILLKVELPLPLFSAKTCEGVDWKCPKFKYSPGSGATRCRLFSVRLKIDSESKNSLRCAECLKAENAFNQLRELIE
jgi:hypothetical protein